MVDNKELVDYIPTEKEIRDLFGENDENVYKSHPSISTNEYIKREFNLKLNDFAKSDAPAQLKNHDIDEFLSLIGQIPEKELERGKYIISEDVLPSPCDGCSNNPKNGGSGICHCVLGQQTIY